MISATLCRTHRWELRKLSLSTHALISPQNPSSPLAQRTDITPSPPGTAFPLAHNQNGTNILEIAHFPIRTTSARGQTPQRWVKARLRSSSSQHEQHAAHPGCAKDGARKTLHNPTREIQILLEQEGLESPTQGTLHLLQVLEIRLHVVYHSFNTQLCDRFETLRKSMPQGVTELVSVRYPTDTL